MSTNRTPLLLTFIKGIARDFEHTDLKKVTLEDSTVYLCPPNSNTLGMVENSCGQTPDGVPFASRGEAEVWLKGWVTKEIVKLEDKINEYRQGLHIALGGHVDTYDDGVE